MYRLKSLQKSVPNGYRFYQPETRWTARPGSFELIVQQVIAHRTGNQKRFPLPTDYDTVAFQVEQFNVQRCLDNGWMEYVTGDTSPPVKASLAPALPKVGARLSAVGRVVAGARNLVDWIRSGEEAVPMEAANRRASICAKCPKNKTGNLEDFFTVAASSAIRRALVLRDKWDLTTSYDDRIQVCDACGCPLKLKVHCPIEFITKRLGDSERSELDPGCWIIAESES